jgi:ligand-binding SRPBCC domain-containing protein
MTTVRYSSEIPASPEAVFAFHLQPANFAAISPRWPRVTVDAPPGTSKPGDRVTFLIGRRPLQLRLVARIERVEGLLLQDRQEHGPFRSWRHQHRVAPAQGGALLTDVVVFRLFPTTVGEFLEYWTVRPLLNGIFRYRHRRTRALLAHHNP